MRKTLYIPESTISIQIPNWLSRVSYTDRLEEEFEKIFFTNAKNIFPDFFCLDFKIKIASKKGNTIPDFVLIAKDYSRWAIGEVELVSHNLNDHVLPQMDKFYLGEWDDHQIVSKLCEKYPSLDKLKIKELVEKTEPQIFLIANEYLDEWSLPLTKRNIKYLSIEVYTSNHSERIIHICGERTQEQLIKISDGVPGPDLMGFHTIYLNEIVNELNDGDSCRIDYNGQIFEWQYFTKSDKGLFLTTLSFKHTKNLYFLYKNPITNILHLA
jgi:hypothetical protein